MEVDKVSPIVVRHTVLKVFKRVFLLTEKFSLEKHDQTERTKKHHIEPSKNFSVQESVNIHSNKKLERTFSLGLGSEFSLTTRRQEELSAQEVPFKQRRLGL